jgi:hypothetical protein
MTRSEARDKKLNAMRGVPISMEELVTLLEEVEEALEAAGPGAVSSRLGTYILSLRYESKASA